MRGRFIDLSGKRFARLSVVKRVEPIDRKKSQTYWLCHCDCGKESIVESQHLMSGRIKSCGCWRKTKAITHGQSKTRLYRVWRGIKERTSYTKNKNYKNYGGRGIKMYKKWQNDFDSFYKWSVQHGYKEGLTIDRIDVNGDYTPNNCRWVSSRINQNNRRNNHILEYRNQKHTISEWSEITGIKYSTLEMRINKYKWPVEKALNVLP